MAFNLFEKKEVKEKGSVFRRGETLEKVHGDLKKNTLVSGRNQ